MCELQSEPRCSGRCLWRGWAGQLVSVQRCSAKHLRSKNCPATNTCSPHRLGTGTDHVALNRSTLHTLGLSVCKCAVIRSLATKILRWHEGVWWVVFPCPVVRLRCRTICALLKARSALCQTSLTSNEFYQVLANAAADASYCRAGSLACTSPTHLPTGRDHLPQMIYAAW